MLSRDFKEFAELLDSSGVEYLVVGGYALAAHGHPRYTGDFDVWLRISSDNLARVLRALQAFGFSSLDLRLPILGLDDFKANKRASGRFKDLADLESLGEPPSRDVHGDPPGD